MSTINSHSPEAQISNPQLQKGDLEFKLDVLIILPFESSKYEVLSRLICSYTIYVLRVKSTRIA
jgi:hypothetical protein